MSAALCKDHDSFAPGCCLLMLKAVSVLHMLRQDCWIFCVMWVSAPDTTRTCYLRLRRPSLYPAELRGQLYSVLPQVRCVTVTVGFVFRNIYISRFVAGVKTRDAGEDLYIHILAGERRYKRACFWIYVLTITGLLGYNDENFIRVCEQIPLKPAVR